MKRKPFSILGSLFILMGGLPAHLCATEDVNSTANPEAQKWIAAESRQKHIVQATSEHVCSEYGNKQAESSGWKCVSLVAELTAEATKSQEYTLPSLENVNWSDSAGFGEVASELGFLQQAEADASGLDGAMPTAEKEVMSTDAEEIVAAQDVDNAIPGSLLVTILALVGIVAVARRDVSGKPTPDPLVMPGAEVARISSLKTALK